LESVIETFIDPANGDVKRYEEKTTKTNIRYDPFD